MNAREAYDNYYHKIKASVGFDEWKKIWDFIGRQLKVEIGAYRASTMIVHSLAAVEADRQQRGEPVAWMPIETAPEEGCWALVCGDGAMDCMFIRKGHAPENWTNPTNPNLNPSEVTHWMPIPEFAPHSAQPCDPVYYAGQRLGGDTYEAVCTKCGHRSGDTLADTQRRLIEAAEQRGYARALTAMDQDAERYRTIRAAAISHDMDWIKRSLAYAELHFKDSEMPTEAEWDQLIDFLRGKQ